MRLHYVRHYWFSCLLLDHFLGARRRREKAIVFLPWNNVKMREEDCLASISSNVLQITHVFCCFGWGHTQKVSESLCFRKKECVSLHHGKRIKKSYCGPGFKYLECGHLAINDLGEDVLGIILLRHGPRGVHNRGAAPKHRLT